jgi:hypothetical protein
MRLMKQATVSNHLYEIPGGRRAGETCGLHEEPFA